MVEEFRKVMRSEDAGFGVRSIVVESLVFGTPQPTLKDDLAAIVVRRKSAYVERRFAILALVKLGDAGKAALVELYRNGLGNRVNELRLRVDILRALYGNPFGPTDVVALIDDLWSSPDELPGGVLWFLSDAIPISDVPAVLDGNQHRKRTKEIGRRNAWDIASFYERILVRAWNEIPEIEPAVALRWLRVHHTFRDGYSSGRDEFGRSIAARRDRLVAIADYFLTGFQPGKDAWLHLHHFAEATLHILTPDDLLGLLMDHFGKATPGSAKQQILYEAMFPYTWSTQSKLGLSIFKKLYELGEDDPGLNSIREAAVCAKLPDRYLDRKVGRVNRDADEEKNLADNRKQFEATVALIRSGSHAGWLAFLGEIYLGMFIDLEKQPTPRERLAYAIGEENVTAAMEGLDASLKRSDLPDLKAVVDLAAERKICGWWHALVVAMDRRFAEDGDLAAFSDDLLSAAVVFELIHPISETAGGVEGTRVSAWKKAALEQCPALVHAAYTAIARARFTNGDQHVDGLRELLTEEALKPYRVVTALGFLREFPNTNIYRLNELLDVVLALQEAHGDFLKMALPIIQGSVPVDAPQYDQWLAASYILSPAQFEKDVEATARTRPSLIFDLRNFGGGGRGNRTIELTVHHLEFLARLTGRLFPYVPTPGQGWSGDTNAWDASDYFNALINSISANPSEAASQALARLEVMPELVSYRPFLLNAKSQQMARRREAEYDRPDWPRTVEALSKGSPATVADLHAMLIGYIEEARKVLAQGNTDGFKKFWNLDSHNRPTIPLPEETCRDRLVEMLRTGLLPLSVTVEPEEHMAHDKRADISVGMLLRKILCELKRDYHPEVWTAAEEQLERFYAHDPDAQGFGVYVVFWFGKRRRTKIPAPPNGKARPTSPAEMERMLQELLPSERAARIAVLVIDVSGEIPGMPQAKNKRRRKKKIGDKKSQRRKTTKPSSRNKLHIRQKTKSSKTRPLARKRKRRGK